MYAHFGLEGSPFSIAPDLHFYIDTDAHRAAMGALQASLARGEVLFALTGEFGTGKTMVARRLAQLVDRDRYVVVELAGWKVEGDDLLTRIAGALRMGEINTALPLGTLMQRLQEIARKDRAALLVIDDAHLLGLDAVRRLAKLTAMRVDGRDVMHVCLAGRSVSPAFDEHARVARPLQIDTRVQLTALDATATDVYIRGRLERAGWKGHPSFGAGAAAEIHARTGGNPGRINRLCAHLLAQLLECRKDVVDVELVRSVADRPQSEFDNFLEDASADRRAQAAPAAARQAPAHAPARLPPRDPERQAAPRDPAVSEVPRASRVQRTAAATDPLLDIESMLQDVIAQARSEMKEAVPPRLSGLAGTTSNGPGTPPPQAAPASKLKSATTWRRGLQTAAALLAFGGGFIAWQRDRAPDVGGADPGRIATLFDKPSPDVAAAEAQRSPALAAAVLASSPARLADAAVNVDLPPPAAGSRVILPSQEVPATVGFAATDAEANVAGSKPVATAARPPAVATVDRSRHRFRTPAAVNGAVTASVPVAIAACSLEAQAMGLCRPARPNAPVRELAEEIIRPPSPAVPPPPQVSCSAAQSALGLCNP